MSYPKLIGLVGRAGTGKDTVRGILERDFGYTGFAFADPIRAMLETLLENMGESTRYMTDRRLKETPIPGLDVSYRHLAQTLGTEWGRAVCPGLWLRIAKASMANLYSESLRHEQFVVSDVRFVDEAAWIREQGGQIWRIARPSALPVLDHLSEREQDSITHDRLIENTGTVEDLWCVVSSLLEGSAK